MQLSEASMSAMREEARRRDPDNIDRNVAAEILGVSLRTLQRWHRQEIGPQRKNEPHKRPVRYSRVEVDHWASSHNSAA